MDVIYILIFLIQKTIPTNISFKDFGGFVNVKVILCQRSRNMLPLFFVHYFLIRGIALLWWNRRTDLPTNVLDATLDLAAACGRLGEDALNGCNAISVYMTVRVHIL